MLILISHIITGAADLGAAFLLVFGLKRMSSPESARSGIRVAGLGMLVCTYGALNEKGVALRLCGVAPRVQKLLQLTKTDGFLSLDASREDSLTALQA